MAGRWTPFKAFVYGQELAIRKGEKKLGRVQSHLLLDGGIIACPPDRQVEFNRKYAEGLRNKVEMFCVEMKTSPVIYMMSEFDLKIRDRAINTKELERFVQVAQETVMGLFPDENHILAVLTADSKVRRSRFLFFF